MPVTMDLFSCVHTLSIQLEITPLDRGNMLSVFPFPVLGKVNFMAVGAHQAVITSVGISCSGGSDCSLVSLSLPHILSPWLIVAPKGSKAPVVDCSNCSSPSHFPSPMFQGMQNIAVEQESAQWKLDPWISLDFVLVPLLKWSAPKGVSNTWKPRELGPAWEGEEPIQRVSWNILYSLLSQAGGELLGQCQTASLSLIKQYQCRDWIDWSVLVQRDLTSFASATEFGVYYLNTSLSYWSTSELIHWLLVL